MHLPPKGRLLLVYAPELRGEQGPLDEGVRFGVWMGFRFDLRPQNKTFNKPLLRWWPYPTPPRVNRLPRLELTPDMTMALDTIQRKRPKAFEPIPFRRWNIKENTMLALLRRGMVRRSKLEGTYYLKKRPEAAPGSVRQRRGEQHGQE